MDGGNRARELVAEALGTARPLATVELGGAAAGTGLLGWLTPDES